MYSDIEGFAKRVRQGHPNHLQRSIWASHRSINASLDELLTVARRTVLIAGIISLGSGRRMLQQWLHSRGGK